MERLKTLRISANLTQQEVANRLGVERSTYVKYERGNSDPPSLTLVKLADMFGVSVDYLLEHDAPCTPPPLMVPVVSASELSMLEKFRALSADSQSFILRILDSEYKSAVEGAG